MIKLSRRLVVPGTPSLPAVHTDSCALINSNRDDVCVFRINPDGVVVIASRSAFDGVEILPRIDRAVGRSVRNVNLIFIFRIDADAAKVVTASPDALFIVD